MTYAGPTRHDGSPQDIERVIALYPLTIEAPWVRQYTDEQLREWLADRCEHGRPTTSICDCGSGDLDSLYCQDCV